MKGDLRGYTENLLFIFNVFVIFLLLFESKLVVPEWLQPFGRMHPLILHFPIVLLFFSMLIEFFGLKTSYVPEKFYQTFTSGLLLMGVTSCGITVIMGLFLSHENGYTGNLLAWHKWTGISVFFTSSIIYIYRNSIWYKAPLARAGSLITVLSLVFAGHFGAALTHGDNFILQPVLTLNPKVVPLQEAILFDHVIKPVLEKKCLACHNPDKLKGELILVDSTSTLKGGKTGELFVAGNPQLSLILQRIHLPLIDEKHMPPSGKTQLTPEEIDLLYLWIKAGGRFSQKVTALPDEDSLRLLAETFLQPDETAGEIFDFVAADEVTIQKLNTNYRVVSQLAQGSPALTVNVYNRDAFTPKTLGELKDVKLQIVSLELSKMPVKNEDLKNIATFKNLQRLNLNFTDITGKGLEIIRPLKHLKSLSIS